MVLNLFLAVEKIKYKTRKMSHSTLKLECDINKFKRRYINRKMNVKFTHHVARNKIM